MNKKIKKIVLTIAVSVTVILISLLIWNKITGKESISDLPPEEFAKYPELKKLVTELQKISKSGDYASGSNVFSRHLGSSCTSKKKTPSAEYDRLLLRIILATMREKHRKIDEAINAVKETIKFNGMDDLIDDPSYVFSDLNEELEMAEYPLIALKENALMVLSGMGKRAASAVPELLNMVDTGEVHQALFPYIFDIAANNAGAFTLNHFVQIIKKLKQAFFFSVYNRKIMISENGDMHFRYFAYTGNSVANVLCGRDGELITLFDKRKETEQIETDSEIFFPASEALSRIAEPQDIITLLNSESSRVRTSMLLHLSFLSIFRNNKTENKEQASLNAEIKDKFKNLLKHGSVWERIAAVFYWEPSTLKELSEIFNREKHPAVRATLLNSIGIHFLSCNNKYLNKICDFFFKIAVNPEENIFVRNIALYKFKSVQKKKYRKYVKPYYSEKFIDIAEDSNQPISLRSNALIAAASTCITPKAEKRIMSILNAYKTTVNIQQCYGELFDDTLIAMHTPKAAELLAEMIGDKSFYGGNCFIALDKNGTPEAALALAKFINNIKKSEESHFSLLNDNADVILKILTSAKNHKVESALLKMIQSLKERNSDKIFLFTSKYDFTWVEDRELCKLISELKRK